MSEWRIFESAAFGGGVWGIEALDDEGDEPVVAPCLPKVKAEIIVQAHNKTLADRAAPRPS